jgi:opacity protein-like surface antigen
MANAYYDFKNDSKFTPFVGFGLGVADIKNAKDNEFTYSLNAGAKYNIDKNVYVGAKAAYTNINGPADQLGLKYQNIEIYTANVALGYEF